MDKLTIIKEHIENIKAIYMPICDDTTINNIYELFENHIIFEPINVVDHVYLGLYYHTLKGDHINMKKHFKYAIKRNDFYAIYYYCAYLSMIKDDIKELKYLKIAMNNNITIFTGYLGSYYQYIKKNYVKMKKYYDIQLDIDIDIVMDMLHKKYSYIGEDYEYTKLMLQRVLLQCKRLVYHDLGIYYNDIDENSNLMKLNYGKAIELGNTKSMYDLGYYYLNKNNYKKAKYYFLKCIQNGDNEGNICLGNYYRSKYKYDKMKHYYLKVIQNYPNIFHDLICHCFDIEQNYKMAKMYISMYFEITEENYDEIGMYYKCRKLHFELLEYLLNNQNNVNRKIIIDLFNANANDENINYNSFKQMIDQYDFIETDKINGKMIEILKSNDKYKIIFKDLIAKFDEYIKDFFYL